MYVTRNMTDLSYPEIGRAFGNRDHTTVIHAVRKIEHHMTERKDIFDKIQDLSEAGRRDLMTRLHQPRGRTVGIIPARLLDSCAQFPRNQHPARGTHPAC